MEFAEVVTRFRGLSFRQLLLLMCIPLTVWIVIANATSGISDKAKAEMAEASRPAPPTPEQLAADALAARRREFVQKEMLDSENALVKAQIELRKILDDSRIPVSLKMEAAKRVVHMVELRDKLREMAEKKAVDTIR
jgi:hypothetical protein